MLELLYGPGGRKASGVTGPGPQAIIKGDLTAGYYGLVTPTEFINGTALATAIGLSSGIAQNSDLPWFKFSSQGKTLFIPQRTFRHTVSWVDVYLRGAVYGTATTGRVNAGTPVMQNRTITINGLVYKVRLMTGDATDPGTRNGGEWNQLFIPLTDTTWGSYVNSDFGATSSQTGSITWCQETKDGTPYLAQRRGWGGVADTATYYTDIGYKAGSNVGWRPVLELVN